MVLLRCDKLSKQYGDRTVVKDVSIDLEVGEIVGLLGPNGAGKTTTFKMTIGMVRPTRGHVYLNGDDITRLPMFKRARLGMAYLSQEPSVFQGLSVEENLLAILETQPLTRKERRNKAVKLMAEFGISKLAKQRSATLSGGEMRRLEIARALTTSPSLILLDEPFSGVDPITVSEIQDIVVSLKKRNIGTLLTDHNVRETLSVTDRSYIIDNSMILAHGKPDEIVSNPMVRKVYLGERFTM
ncbi:MAG: LPS export ABC transporter ATP-binding protein [Planctomycetota bacterium]|nr:LPS export ABC transporter ATP-binding protein [Planctomycetota bacterium]